MARSTSSPSGRALLLILLMALVILAVYDIFSPDSLLRSLWEGSFSRKAPVEGVRDGVMDRLGIPR